MLHTKHPRVSLVIPNWELAMKIREVDPAVVFNIQPRPAEHAAQKVRELFSRLGSILGMHLPNHTGFRKGIHV